MAKKIIISGGGTGGHIYPAIAIAHALKAADPDIDILFVGAEGKMEMEKVPRAGYRIIGLPVVGIKRSLSPANLAFPFKLVRSLLKARRVLRDFGPDAAVGVGGFASGPLLMIASHLRIPTLIQEQNSYAGITNKLLSHRARTICVAYPGMDAFFPESKIRLLGNPVRPDMIGVNEKREQAYAHFNLDRTVRTIFVMGGSLGARSINESIANGLKELADAGCQVLWQTGRLFAAQAQELISRHRLGDRVKSAAFIYEMDLAYAVSDVVISRAGALSVSELCLVGRPAILVPFPHATADHQTKNALTLTSRGAAILVRDADAGNLLVKTALDLLDDPDRQAQLTGEIVKLARPEAAADIAREVLKLT